MKSLFISTSTKELLVAIVIDNDIKYLYSNEINADMSSTIMPVIDDAFNKTQINVKDIDTIFVTNGPGSFTGIRIGLTIVKVIAWSLNIKVIPISSLELMASGFDKMVLPIIDARRGYVFSGLYDENLNVILKDQYIEFDKLIADLNKKGINNYEIVSNDFDYTKPKYNIAKVIEKHKNDLPCNPHKLNPNYLKKTEAEEKLNESR